MGAGMDAFLSKPFDREGLKNILVLVLQGQPSFEESRSDGGTPLVVDQRALLVSMGGEGDLDREGLKELLDLFERHAPRQLQDLAEAVGRGDGGAAREAAHSLCGSSAYVFARKLAADCKEAEKEAAHGDLEALKARLPGLEVEYTAAWSVLEGIRTEFA
jgi:HPt (histidine-containing phosphotransfer) domain-containing protein